MTRQQGLIRATLFVLLLNFGALASAQDNVGEDSTVRYPASYFTEFSPVTAQDMMDRIPGMNSGGNRGGGGP